MNIVKHVKDNFPSVSRLNKQYVATPPHPTLCLDNFIPLDTVRAMKAECDSLQWDKEFTRAGSHMVEKSDLDDCPVATDVKNQLSSASFLKWLGDITGHYDIIPDPYMVGAGYMRCASGHSLKIRHLTNCGELDSLGVLDHMGLLI